MRPAKGTGGVLEIHGPQPQWHAMEDAYTSPEDTKPGYGGDKGYLLVQDWLDCIRTGRRDNRNGVQPHGGDAATDRRDLSEQPRGAADRVPHRRGEICRGATCDAGKCSGVRIQHGSSYCITAFHLNSRLVSSMFRFLALYPCRSFTAPIAFAENWPQFRGPQSAGKATPEQPLPTNIGPEQHVLWKTPLPPGHSSPVIIDDKIFLTAVADAKHLETICLDRASGKIRWRVEAPHQTLEQIHGIGSYAQPSPAADSECVVAMFGSSGLYCYDHAGKELWHIAMGPFSDEFGAASSPILVGDRVMVAQDHDLDSFVAAYDKRTGKELWRRERSEFLRGYSTPVLWKNGDQDQVVVAGSLRVVGYDLASGKEAWTVRGLSRVVVMTPVVGEDGTLYVAGWSAGGDAGDLIRMEPFADFAAQFDENKNGTLEKNEVSTSAALKTRFAQCDRDKDGHITEGEYDDISNVVRQVGEQRDCDQARPQRGCH